MVSRFAAVLLLGLCGCDGGSAASVQPALDLITRNFGASATSAFNLTVDANACEEGSSEHGCFSMAQRTSGLVDIKATSMSDLTYGIGYYIRFSCELTVGWKRGGGSRTDAAAWPCHTGTLKPTTISRAVPYTYEDNVCTHSYSYVWYGEAEWTAHIDWMALQGINIFLAMTGQEEVQYKAFRKFGMGDREIREFFNGPAYLTWSRGQSMQSVGSSAVPEGGESGLPRSWMQAQWRLQKFILGRARSLGIIGVLPAFQGNLPPQIKTLQPAANISLTRHTDGYNDSKGQCAWLAASDPLFGQIADAWMKIMLADFGTDHWYQCDGFFTGAKPPWYDTATSTAGKIATDDDRTEISSAPPVNPNKVVAAPDWLPVWKGAWEGMAKTDPQARWLYQGWAIRGWSDAAGASRLKALYESVPHGQWVPLDMDIGGIWKYWGNYSFFGAPFIWTTIHNMGGNDGMKGDMRMLTDLPSQAISAGASIIGTGATPEGIDQNPVYYEYLFDTAWHASPQPLEAWFASYPTRRYGKATDQATDAWQLLGSTVYHTQAGGWHDDTGVEWNALSPPPMSGAGHPWDGSGSRGGAFPTDAVYKAWKLLVDSGAADPKTCATFNYDVVNAGREVLAQIITIIEGNLTAAVASGQRSDMLASASTLMDAYADLDELLGCEYGFLLGVWIKQAKQWVNATDGGTDGYYEWQARSQVSTWWPIAPSARQKPTTFTKLPVLDDYANKHWNGLVRDFYAKRVQCYIDQAAIDMPLPSPPPPPGPTDCKIKARVAGSYLSNYPKSLPGCDGVHPPSSWPYDTNSLAAAEAWCCKHDDCGGITHQNGRYEVRKGGNPIHDPATPLIGSWPKAGAAGGTLNHANLTKCVTTAELDFTQGTTTTYLERPTTEKTLSLSSRLISKYAAYF